MLKKLLLAFVFFVLLLIGVNQALPATARFEVSESVQGDRARMLAAVSDFRTWPEWSVWSHEKDPEAKFTFSDDAGQVGHRWDWTGDGPLGEGHMVLTEVSESGITYELTLVEPMGLEMTGRILLPEGEAPLTWTSVTDDSLPLIGRLLNKLFAGAIKADYVKSIDGLRAFVARQGE